MSVTGVGKKSTKTTFSQGWPGVARLFLFKPNSQFGEILDGPGWKMLIYFMAIGTILQIFGIF
jgi:hypothetical protein